MSNSAIVPGEKWNVFRLSLRELESFELESLAEFYAHAAREKIFTPYFGKPGLLAREFALAELQRRSTH